MAVTTTKTNIMTIIEEDGGDPTGAGGKVINDNFKKIDALFDGDDCKSAISLTQAPDIAKNTGFSNPTAQGANYRVTSGNTHYPVAVWGTSFQTGLHKDGYCDVITEAPIARVPPYGPFMYRVMAYVAPNTRQDEGDCIECIVHGYNGSLLFGTEGSSVTYAMNYNGYTQNWNITYFYYNDCLETVDRTILFSAENGILYCGARLDNDEKYTACIMHVTAIALYTDDTQFTTENIYYQEEDSTYPGSSS